MKYLPTALSLGAIASVALSCFLPATATARTLSDFPLASESIQQQPLLSVGRSVGNDLPGQGTADFAGRVVNGRALAVREADLERNERVARARIAQRFAFERIGSQIVRLDTATGEVAFLNVRGNEARWETLLIDEAFVGNRDAFYAEFVHTLRKGE